MAAYYLQARGAFLLHVCKQALVVNAAAPSSPHLPLISCAPACLPARCLQMQPHLFREAVETAFQRIKEAREEDEAAEKAQVRGGRDGLWQ